MNTERSCHWIVCLICVISLSACVPSQAEINATATSSTASVFITQTAQSPTPTLAATPTPVKIYNDTEIVKMIWDTTGGGDLKFEITKEGEYFQIRVLRRAFNNEDAVVSLTAENETSYRFVQDIFEKKRDLYDDTFVPLGATGSWTSITLVHSSGEQVTINNILAWEGDPQTLYEFVENSFTIVPTPTSLESSILVSGDLPLEIAGGQTSRGVPPRLADRFRGVPTAETVIAQEFEANLFDGPGAVLFVYRTPLDANQAFQVITDVLKLDFRPLADVGQIAMIAQERSSSPRIDDNYVVFVRCRAVVYLDVFFAGKSSDYSADSELDIVTAYAKRLDARLMPLICP